MKQIFVQAQADHIESLFKGSPLTAIEELVWNALDADAKEVKVDLITNPLGAVEAVRVADDGTGIDALKADQTFGSLGGSLVSGRNRNRSRFIGEHSERSCRNGCDQQFLHLNNSSCVVEKTADSLQ